MTYVTRATEMTTGPGNANEARALFYLMGQDEDRDEMSLYIVDVFNDLVGSNNNATRLWDLQSKNAKSGPKNIGKELVTLFRNYMSEFRPHFVRQILFLGSVTGTVRRDESMVSFRYEDIKEVAQNNLRIGLKEELLSKTYIDNEWVTDGNIDGFLRNVEFVVVDRDNASYVRPLIGAASEKLVDDRKLTAIFNEVRDMQSSKKSITCEGVELSRPHEVFKLGKHLSRKSILRLVLARIINRDPISSGIPTSFLAVYQSYPPEQAEEMLEDCQNALALQMFDKNAKEAFWDLLDRIIEIVTKDKMLDPEAVYNLIDSDLLTKCVHLDPLSTQFFIAQIKDGLK